MRYIHLAICVTLLTLCGCGNDAQSTEAKEERNPLIKQGHAYMEIRDYAQAETAFKEAIIQNPAMARPYLDLATIYHQYKPDYIASIYYYKRYLELRPDSEKAEFIQEQITKVQDALVNAILTRSGALQAIDELQKVRAENAELKRQLAQHSTAPADPAPQKSVTETVPKNSGVEERTTAGHQIYTVVAGDNLTKIAKKFYGTDEYQPIYEANRDSMNNPGDLRVGQTLVIPNR